MTNREDRGHPNAKTAITIRVLTLFLTGNGERKQSYYASFQGLKVLNVAI